MYLSAARITRSAEVDRPRLAKPAVLLVALALSAVLLSPSVAGAQAKADESFKSTVTLESKADRLPIHISYFAADPGKIEGELEAAPVVILVHGQNGSRLDWENKPTNFRKKPMTEVLRDNGYAVVTVDLRGHGESVLKDGRKVGAADYEAMLGDLEAVKDFLLEEHQNKRLNINKLGIVAADDMTPIAIRYAELDWLKPDYDDAPVASRRTPRGRDVRSLVLLSPKSQSGRVSAAKSSVFLKNKNVLLGTLIAYGTDDRLDDKFSGRLAKQFQAIPIDKLNEATPEPAEAAVDPLATKEPFVPPNVVAEYPSPFRGTDLIGQPGMLTELHVMQFLDKTLKPLDIPWRNRKSRIAR